ncbi:MAG: CBS domain-containing protein [Anaerolineae bacterium]
MKIAADVMTRDVVSIPPNATVAEAIQLMHEKGVSSLLVEPRSDMDTHGFMSRRDIVERVVAKGRRPEDCLVTDIMSKPLITVPPDCDLRDCASLMGEAGIRRVVVFDGQKIVGIVSNTDILRAAADGESSERKGAN